MVKIEKEEKAIIAYTANYKIRGKVFMPPGGRLSDFIGGAVQKKFMPVVDAIVTGVSGGEICRTKFLQLNKSAIIFILPETELI